MSYDEESYYQGWKDCMNYFWLDDWDEEDEYWYDDYEENWA